MYQSAVFGKNFILKCSLRKVRLFKSVSGKRLKNIRQISATDCIQRSCVQFAVHVIENLHHSLILGFDLSTLTKINLILKLTPCYLKITSANSNVYSVQTRVGYARSAKSYTIPKQTETIVMVKVSRRKPNDVVLLEPLDQLSSLNLVAAKSLVQVKNSRGFFKIMNPTDKKNKDPF